jgi:DNA-binding PadR family transcriptional regulator
LEKGATRNLASRSRAGHPLVSARRRIPLEGRPQSAEPTLSPIILSSIIDPIFPGGIVRPHWFYILVSLAEADRHGSAIMRDVLELTDGALKLWPATLYGSLDELREQGWIRELEHAPAHADERGHKRWFRITAPGRRALGAEAARLEALARVAARRLAAGDA